MNIHTRINKALASLGEAVAEKSSRLDSATKRKINAALAKGITSGSPYAQSFGQGLNAAFDVLKQYGIEPGHTVSPPHGNSGRVTVDLAFTNTEDGFSPTDITNSVLVLTFHNMNTGVEIIAYVS